MIGIVFAVLVISSFISAGICGNIAEVGTAVITGADDAVKLSFSMLGVMCIWNGIIRVLDKAGFTKILAKIIAPILRIIYPSAYKDGYAISDISADYSANLLGLGNAALPLGIRAMNSLKKQGLPCKDTANDDMIMFSVLNTAPIQLIPATLIAMRTAHGSNNSSEIIAPVWICSLTITVFGVILCKILSRAGKSKCK